MSAEVSFATISTNTSGSNTNTGATRANTTVYGYAPQGIWGTDPLFIKPAGEGIQVVYPITDHLGTPQMLVNQAGDIVWEWQCSAFGIQLNQARENNYTNSTQALRFPGQYADSETRLYYNWNRYYDPETGRYITSDPMGLYDGANSFVYAASSPQVYFDSFGLYKWPGTIKDEATEETKKRFPDRDKDGHWNGKANAFRHCLASCENSNENGTFVAWFVGDAHEVRGNIQKK